MPPEGSLLPETYQRSEGHDAHGASSSACRQEHAQVPRRQRGSRAAGPALQDAGGGSRVRVHRREGDRARRRARARRRRVHEPPAQDMRLQSDPTVIYGLVGGQGPLGRPITRADLDQKSAHNTYQIDGLPPTPICNPGRARDRGELNPADDQRSLFRRRRHRWPRVLRHAEGAQRGGHQLAQGRERTTPAGEAARAAALHRRRRAAADARRSRSRRQLQARHGDPCLYRKPQAAGTGQVQPPPAAMSRRARARPERE